MTRPDIGVRWTIGDVSPQGFEALRLSLWGAWRVFGADARYAVCVNSTPLSTARERTGDVPDEIAWYDATEDLPSFLRPHLDHSMAEGVGWKLAPLRMFPDRWELSLDNDCILWDLPVAIATWLEEQHPTRCVIAEDVRTCFGRFADLAGAEPRNSGIRGLPAGFDLEEPMRGVLAARPGTLISELDEQGLQVAALSRPVPPHVVTVDEVTICSPFPPHQPHLGRCGAHFVGLNVKHVPWGLDGQPAVELLRAHWERFRPEAYARVGLAPPR